MSKQACKLILALDLPNRESAFESLKKLQGSLEWVKIGLQMYLKYGASFVEEVANMGFNIFLDLKLYDIPNTVCSAIKSVGTLPIQMLTIHASGGEEMMSKAVETAKQVNPNLELLAVSVLTSFDEAGLANTGVSLSPKEQVGLLAKLAVKSDIKGMVCSPMEIELLRKILPEEIDLVCPGIRPKGSNSNEQKRIMTPEQAAMLGASYIVVGRPILQAENPFQVAVDIMNSIK